MKGHKGAGEQGLCTTVYCLSGADYSVSVAIEKRINRRRLLVSAYKSTHAKAFAENTLQRASSSY